MFRDIETKVWCHSDVNNFKIGKRDTVVVSIGTDPHLPYEKSDAGLQTIQKVDRNISDEKSKLDHIKLPKFSSTFKFDDTLTTADLYSLYKISKTMLIELARPNVHLDYLQRLNTKRATSNNLGTAHHKFSLCWKKSRNKNNFLSRCEVEGSLQHQLGLKITGMSWSANGKLLAVAYGSKQLANSCDFMNLTTCSGAVVVWNFSGKNYFQAVQNGIGSFIDPKLYEPEDAVEYESPILCIAAHPCNPSIFVAGSSRGEVLLFDFSSLNETKNALVSCSNIGTYFHQEAVNSICWKYDSHRHDWVLCTASEDGKILFWITSNQAHVPISGISIGKSNETIKKHSLPSLFRGATAIGASSSSFQFNDSVYVGSEGGYLVKLHQAESINSTIRDVKRESSMKWSTNALQIISRINDSNRKEIIRNIEKKATSKKKRGIDTALVYDAKIPEHILYPQTSQFSFMPHTDSIRSVDVCPFDSNIFLSCSLDGEVRVYSTTRNFPILVVEPSLSNQSLSNQSMPFSVLDGKFSRTKSSVFAVSSEDGYIYIYDLSKSCQLPVETLKSPKANARDPPPVHSVEFNRSEPTIFATGDSHGMIHIWELPSCLTNDDSKASAMKKIIDYKL